MSVSAGCGVSGGGGNNVDLDAIVRGGPAFIERMAEYQQAAARYQKQVDDLRLGKAAIDAYNESTQLRDEARQILLVAQDQAKKIVAAAEARAAEIDKGIADVKAKFKAQIAKAPAL